tara:strand:- start:49 stop:267 length:219 start_codon:yes stop_codon:yes gene_type:complete
MAVFVHFESVKEFKKSFDLAEPEQKEEYNKFMKLPYKEKVAYIREIDECIHTAYNTDYVEALEYARLGEVFC